MALGPAPSLALAARWLGGDPDSPRLASLGDGTGDNEIGLYVNVAQAGLVYRVVAGGSITAEGGAGVGDIERGDRIAIALRAGADGLRIFTRRNGGAVAGFSGEGLTLPSPVRLEVGSALVVERVLAGGDWADAVLAGHV